MIIRFSLFKRLWAYFQRKERAKKEDPLILTPTQKTTLQATQWSLGEGVNGSQKVKVEVEYYPRESCENHLKNYTAEGEDPNLRITHYPPNHRLH